jgi:hypothetical protein
MKSINLLVSNPQSRRNFGCSHGARPWSESVPVPILSCQIDKPGGCELQRLLPSGCAGYTVHSHKIMHGVWLHVHEDLEAVLFHLGCNLSTFLVECVTFPYRDERLWVSRECTGRGAVLKEQTVSSILVARFKDHALEDIKGVSKTSVGLSPMKRRFA